MKSFLSFAKSRGQSHTQEAVTLAANVEQFKETQKQQYNQRSVAVRPFIDAAKTAESHALELRTKAGVATGVIGKEQYLKLANGYDLLAQERRRVASLARNGRKTESEKVLRRSNQLQDTLQNASRTYSIAEYAASLKSNAKKQGGTLGELHQAGWQSFEFYSKQHVKDASADVGHYLVSYKSDKIADVKKYSQKLADYKDAISKQFDDHAHVLGTVTQYTLDSYKWQDWAGKMEAKGSTGFATSLLSNAKALNGLAWAASQDPSAFLASYRGQKVHSGADVHNAKNRVRRAYVLAWKSINNSTASLGIPKMNELWSNFANADIRVTEASLLGRQQRQYDGKVTFVTTMGGKPRSITRSAAEQARLNSQVVSKRMTAYKEEAVSLAIEGGMTSFLGGSQGTAFTNLNDAVNSLTNMQVATVLGNFSGASKQFQRAQVAYSKFNSLQVKAKNQDSFAAATGKVLHTALLIGFPPAAIATMSTDLLVNYEHYSGTQVALKVGLLALSAVPVIGQVGRLGSGAISRTVGKAVNLTSRAGRASMKGARVIQGEMATAAQLSNFQKLETITGAALIPVATADLALTLQKNNWHVDAEIFATAILPQLIFGAIGAKSLTALRTRPTVSGGPKSQRLSPELTAIHNDPRYSTSRTFSSGGVKKAAVSGEINVPKARSEPAQPTAKVEVQKPLLRDRLKAKAQAAKAHARQFATDAKDTASGIRQHAQQHGKLRTTGKVLSTFGKGAFAKLAPKPKPRPDGLVSMGGRSSPEAVVAESLVKALRGGATRLREAFAPLSSRLRSQNPEVARVIDESLAQHRDLQALDPRIQQNLSQHGVQSEAAKTALSSLKPTQSEPAVCFPEGAVPKGIDIPADVVRFRINGQDFVAWKSKDNVGGGAEVVPIKGKPGEFQVKKSYTDEYVEHAGKTKLFKDMQPEAQAKQLNSKDLDSLGNSLADVVAKQKAAQQAQQAQDAAAEVRAAAQIKPTTEKMHNPAFAKRGMDGQEVVLVPKDTAPELLPESVQQGIASGQRYVKVTAHDGKEYYAVEAGVFPKTHEFTTGKVKGDSVRGDFSNMKRPEVTKTTTSTSTAVSEFTSLEDLWVSQSNAGDLTILRQTRAKLKGQGAEEVQGAIDNFIERRRAWNSDKSEVNESAMKESGRQLARGINDNPEVTGLPSNIKEIAQQLAAKADAAQVTLPKPVPKPVQEQVAKPAEPVQKVQEQVAKPAETKPVEPVAKQSMIQEAQSKVEAYESSVDNALRLGKRYLSLDSNLMTEYNDLVINLASAK
ncbi:MAG: hypothetical protein ABID61_00530, partial [Candidatus Micrarchaeota archaeon]